MVKLGSTFADLSGHKGDFEHWVVQGLGLGPDRVEILRPRNAQALPDWSEVDAVVLTGAHEMVTDRADWSVNTARWLARRDTDAPVLGICYGHQLLADAMGAKAGDNPQGRQFGTVEVRLTPQGRRDRLLGSLPDCFPAHTCHAQAIVSPPAGGAVLATSDRDAFHAVRFGPNCWGVQFHPEFDDEAARAYIERTADALIAQGDDPQALLASVRPTPESASVLRRFAQICLSR